MTPEEVGDGFAIALNLQMNWQMIYYFFLPFSHSISLYLPLSFALSLALALIFCKPALNESPDHQTIAPEQTAPHRIVPHRTAPSTPLSLATANCLQPPATRLTAYSQLPHHRLHPRHATPFHRLWHHKITT